MLGTASSLHFLQSRFHQHGLARMAAFQAPRSAAGAGMSRNERSELQRGLTESQRRPLERRGEIGGFIPTTRTDSNVLKLYNTPFVYEQTNLMGDLERCLNRKQTTVVFKYLILTLVLKKRNI